MQTLFYILNPCFERKLLSEHFFQYEHQIMMSLYMDYHKKKVW